MESLLGQALRLDDEPTLVRAVKAVKRTVARNRHFQKAYIALVISLIAVIVLLSFRGSQKGVSLSLIVFGTGRVFFSNWRVIPIFTGLFTIDFGVFLGIPVSGLEIPYHPLLLRIYHPTNQFASCALGLIFLFSVLCRDIFILVTLKLERWKKQNQEKEERERKLRGIFYTPVKKDGRNDPTQFGWNEGNARARNKFTLS